ncbi:MAG TPA: hypothetical protein VGN52_21050 [Burkholderiales bacterium]
MLRLPGIRRHLRRLYADPLTGKPGWGTIPAPGGGIMGVYSLAKGTPIKIALFDPELADFEGKTSYADWQFSYVAPGLIGPDGKPLANPASPNANLSATSTPVNESGVGSQLPSINANR